MESIWGLVERFSAQQLTLALVALCLLLVVLMGVALLILGRRAREAENQAQKLSEEVYERLGAVSEWSEHSGEKTKREIKEAMKSVNDTVTRMMGEITRTQQGQMDSLGGQLRAAGRQEEERMERMREALEGGLSRMSEENRAQMEQMRLVVDEKLNATVDQRLEASFEAVTKRLEQVNRSLTAMQSLAGSVDELSRTLGSAQPLGVWGEVQLGTLLAQMLAPEQYAQHASVRPGGDPVADYVVVMPGQGHGHTVYLPIDASLPMREYAELRVALEEGTREQVDNARGMLESAVRMHARRMSEKLIAPPYTTDYAVMFLQSEGLFAEVLRIGGLAERIQQESRMVIAGPTTLAALLTSLQMGFRSLAIEQRTEEIAALLGAVRSDIGSFAGLLSRTQKQLRQASESIESAQRHSENLARRLSDVGELPREEAERLLGVDEQEMPDDDSWD